MPRVLVVDDMPIFRDSIEMVLRTEGYDVITAANGQEAISLLTTGKPELVLLDLGMPIIDGLAVLRFIRQHEKTRETLVFILSAEADRARITEAAKLGISGYMLKAQFSLKDMLKKVKGVFAERGLNLAATGDLRELPVQAVDTRRPAGVARESKEAAVAPRAEPVVASSVPALPVGTLLSQSNAPPRVSKVTGPGDVPVDIKSLKPILTRSELLERLKACEELKGFSPTVSQVLKLTGNSKSSVDAVSKAVRQDQAMALKILKIANSSVYSRGDRVDNVHKAILRIGMDSIRQAVLNIAVVERFSSVAFQEHISTQQFWEHSIACGIIAAEIAHATDSKEADSAFTSGLLHDLGRVIFAEALGAQYIHVIETARRLEAPLETVETRMLLLNHADVMDRMLTAWKFPKHLVDPIMYHHLSAGNARQASPTRVSEVLRLGLANRLAHAMLLGCSGNETIYPTEEHCQALGISAATIRSIEETARQQTDDTKFALLSSTSSAAWPRRSEQLRAMLTSPFRPLYISAAPEFDAYRIFCAEFAGPSSGEAPNLIVLHIASSKERGPLVEQMATAERDAGVQGLPVLIVASAGQAALNDASLASRRCQMVHTPLTVSRFIATTNALLSTESARAAAA